MVGLAYMYIFGVLFTTFLTVKTSRFVTGKKLVNDSLGSLGNAQVKCVCV